MQRIDRMQELEPFGIAPLTGESDARMYRILCDVTARGKGVIERTMGVEVKLSDNWNSGKLDDPRRRIVPPPV